MDAADRDRFVALLDFHVAAGVDVALDEVPHDRFAETIAAEAAPRSAALPSRAPPGAVEAPPLPGLPPSPDAVLAEVRAKAAEAETLDDLRALLEAFDGCPLKASARQLVFADGVAGSRVMLLGEAPGAEEDRTGTPFVGRAGQLLDLMLAAIGLDRASVYIANVVPWRPPGNRTPTPQEVAVCLPFTLRQIELARPDILVTLGAPATQMVLGVKDGILRMRGRIQDHMVGARALRVLPMLHPAYLLRNPVHKRFAWRDLQLLRRELDGGDPPSQL